jgi:hypothetical protein
MRYASHLWFWRHQPKGVIKVRRLSVAIPPEIASPDQLRALARAMDYAKEHDVILRYILVG